MLDPAGAGGLIVSIAQPVIVQQQQQQKVLGVVGKGLLFPYRLPVCRIRIYYDADPEAPFHPDLGPDLEGKK